MEINWLWDSQLSEDEVQKILKEPNHPKFDLYAEKLLSRVADPKVVFNWVQEMGFCQKWPWIKKRMRKDRWLKERVIFWQTIYERCLERLKERGIRVRKFHPKEKIASERIQLAEQIRQIRTKLGLTQQQVAEKLGVIQQFVSKIEKGHENVSVDTLKRISQALGKRLVIELR